MAVKSSIGGVGAPTPLFDSYPSSCDHLFMENTSKLHFLYHTNLVGYEYVDKNLEKIPPKLFKGGENPYSGIGAPMPFKWSLIQNYKQMND